MDILQPFLLSLIAGLATGIGGILVVLLGKLSNRVVGFSLGVASGVMLMVAFNDLFLEAVGILTHLQLIIAFSFGAIIIMVIDLAIPHIELTAGVMNGTQSKMYKTGVLIALGIAIHNFPEGLVVSAGYTFLPKLGFAIAIAIALHNIPEGVATAIPLSVAGIKRSRITIVTFLSGLTEPIAAFVGAVALSFFKNEIIVGSALAFAAGVMTYITADELIPVAHEYGHKHVVSIGLLMGMLLALLIDVILS
ncbi:MAG: zinc transporter, family [Thermoproteota archaeon]|nr:zinc transporter, family [Thermoproteota archaeon]